MSGTYVIIIDIIKKVVSMLTSLNALIHGVKRRFNPSKNNKEKSFLRFFKSKQTSNRMIA